MNVLWIGDAACSSGFGKATHHIAKRIVENGHELNVIGINYRGDPHDEPYRIWPAIWGGDQLGLGAFRKLYPEVGADVVVLQTNPWHVPNYVKVMEKFSPRAPMVGIVAVEGKNCTGSDLNTLSRAVFWTEFGRAEAIASGTHVPTGVVGLGVDPAMYHQFDKVEARKMLRLPTRCWGARIFANVNRNQWRKRLDLSVQFFAKYLERTDDDAYLYLHAAPGSSVQLDLDQLADYYGVRNRLILPEFTDPFKAHAEEFVAKVMQACDVHINTGLGEGFGLTTLESMACGRPNIATRAAAIPEWSRGAVDLVDGCCEGVMPDVRGQIGTTPDADKFVDAMTLYREYPKHWDARSTDAFERSRDPEFDWSNVADGFIREIEAVLR